MLPQICETKYNKTIPPHVFPSIDTYDLRLIRGRLQKKKVATAFLLEGVAAVLFCTGIGRGPNRKGILLDRTRKFANLKNQQLLHVSFS